MKHAFVRRLTNEGVLTFRCFLSKSWLKGWNIWGEKTIMRIHFSTDLQTNYVQHVGPGCKRLRVAARFFTRRKQKKKKRKGCFISSSEGTEAGVNSSWRQYRGRRGNLRETHETSQRCLFCPCCGSCLQTTSTVFLQRWSPYWSSQLTGVRTTEDRCPLTIMLAVK